MQLSVNNLNYLLKKKKIKAQLKLYLLKQSNDTPKRSQIQTEFSLRKRCITIFIQEYKIYGM